MRTPSQASFGLTFDYLCPFARNANEHVVAALEAGAPWQVDFAPFSLSQAHAEEDEVAVWARPDAARASGLLALAVATSVRALAPERFLAAHVQLFALRHDHGRDLRDESALAEALHRAGIGPAAILARAHDEGLAEVAASHTRMTAQHQVWGVPTFIGSGRAVFVRILDRPDGDGERALRRIGRVLELLEGEAELHEFKQVDLPR
jgi:protein-disulfide isomerase